MFMIIDICHVFQCWWITMSDALLFLCSVNCIAQPHQSGAIYQTRPFIKTDRDHHFASAATCTNHPVCREPVCHLSSALSHRSIKEIYSVVKIPLRVCASEFIRLYAVSPSDVRPGKFGRHGPSNSLTRLKSSTLAKPFFRQYLDNITIKTFC